MPALSGLLIAAAIDSKPWAAAFAVLLLALPHRKRAGGLTALRGGVAVAWLPFLIGDPATLGLRKFRINNAAASALNAIGIHTASTPWWDRPAQLIIGVLIGALLLHRGHWNKVLLAALCARLLLDPQIYPYYTSGLVVGTAAIDLTSPRKLPRMSLATQDSLIPASVRHEALIRLRQHQQPGCRRLEFAVELAQFRHVVSDVLPDDDDRRPGRGHCDRIGRCRQSDQHRQDGGGAAIDLQGVDGGWLAIHQDLNGKPGPIVGFAAVKKGMTKDLTVTLDRTITTRAFWPMLRGRRPRHRHL